MWIVKGDIQKKRQIAVIADVAWRKHRVGVDKIARNFFELTGISNNPSKCQLEKVTTLKF